MAKKIEKPQTLEEVLENEGAVVTTLEEVLASADANELAAADEVDDEKTKFINDNINFVPTNRRNAFLTWDIDKQYQKLNKWKTKAEWRAQVAEANKIENKVKQLFIDCKVTEEEVARVIDFCNNWIEDARQSELIRIDEEIMRLEERRTILTQGA